MKIQSLWTALLIFGISASSNAQAVDCGTAKTEASMNECVVKELRAATVEINRIYSQYRVRLDESQKQQLKEAQFAWMKFRDLDCKFQSSGVTGGSAAPMVMHSCLAEKTRQRIIELKSLASCREGDLSCPAWE